MSVASYILGTKIFSLGSITKIFTKKYRKY